MLILMGVLFSAAAGLFYEALTRIPAGTAILVQYWYPALVAVVSWLVGRERLANRKATALILALSGVLLVMGAPDHRLDPLGVVLALGSGGAVAAMVLMSRRAVQGVHSLPASAIVLTSSAAAFLVWVGTRHGMDLVFEGSGWGWAVLIGVTSGFGYPLFFSGLVRVGATSAAIGATFEPAMTVILAAVLLGEHLAQPQLLGAGLVLASIAFLTRLRASREALSQRDSG
jgi:drug/metabolite transporter (DMT)-like permease